MAKIITTEYLNEVRFYQMPKAFFHNPKYISMRNESKLVYMFLRDLLTLSIQNNWVNERQEVFVKLSREKMMFRLHIKGTQKMAAIMKELVALDLIVDIPVGLNRCNELYICIPDDLGVVYSDKDLIDLSEEKPVGDGDDMPEEQAVPLGDKASDDVPGEKALKASQPYNIRGFENQSSIESLIMQGPLKIKAPGLRKSKLQAFENQSSKGDAKTHIEQGLEAPKKDPIKTNPIKTDFKDTKSVSQSVGLKDNTASEIDNKNRQTDGQTDLDLVYELIKENIKIDELYEMFLSDSDLISEIDLNILDMVYSEGLTVSGSFKPQSLVRASLMRLEWGHIEYVINKFKAESLKSKIYNNKKYIQSMLFNAPFESNHFIRNDVANKFGI